MAEIFDFTKHRLQKTQPAKIITIDDLKREAVDFLLADWEKMARNNRLNDYFKSSLPNSIDSVCKVNYMADLNGIAALELNLELFPAMFGPGATRKEQLGWMVQFKIGDQYVCTPELASEAYARCFGILLYLRVKHAALEAGLL